MTDDFDPRPERTLYYRRLIERLIASPELEVTLVHAKAVPDEPLYAQTREVIMPRVQLPFGSRFVAFLRYCLTTEDRYDIVHWLKPRIFPFFWLFPARRIIVMAHGGGDVFVPGIWTLSRRIFNWTMIYFGNRIHTLIAVSEYANKEIVYAYRAHPEKVVTIYNPVDPLYTQPFSETVEAEIRREHGLREPYFFSISRFRLHKNIGRTVEAFVRYRTEHPESREHLALGGGSLDEFETAYGPLLDSPYTKDIHFLGYIPSEHLPALYRGATALVFISLNEGFGLPVVEAMACKTPVIVSNVTSLPEIAGDAGVIVDPQSTSDVAAAMSRVALDEPFRRQLVERGYKRSTFFTWDKNFASVLALYKRALSQ